MHQRIVYEAKDGRQFADPYDASRHEEVIDDIKLIYQMYDGVYHDQFIQRTAKEYTYIKDIGRQLLLRYYDAGSKTISLWDENPLGLVSRLLDDDNNPVSRICYLLGCFDHEYRQYSQPYYANLAKEKNRQG